MIRELWTLWLYLMAATALVCSFFTDDIDEKTLFWVQAIFMYVAVLVETRNDRT